MGTSVAGPGSPGISGGFSLTGPGIDQDVLDFFNILESGDLSIEAPVSEEEANQAITLFSVVNMLVGGSSPYKVGNETKTDILGVLTLFYSLQDRSLPNKIVVRSATLWGQIQDSLKDLRDRLEILGADVDFLKKQAKRQFNLGPPVAEVVGNTDFPKMFKRYVDISNDPLLTLDLRTEQSSTFSDKEKIAQAFDLLAELKGLILQIVRSLSKNGTVATEQANHDWARYEHDALLVLKQVADARISDDQDDLRVLSVLADLTGKPFDTKIAPYIALARDGGRLLQIAMSTYLLDKENLDNYDNQYLLDLFQKQGDIEGFITTQIRKEALVIKKYPLTDWMG